jgi:hypothetical protein
MESFEDFKKTVRKAERDGAIKIPIQLSDFDLAVQWALCCIAEKKGNPCEATMEEIWYALPDEFKEYTEEE